MSYYIAATLQAPFEEAIKQTEAALKEEGFGIISRIDFQEALKTKIGVDFRPYTILGACNVVVQAREDGSSEVAAIDPVASMQAIENPQLVEAAREVRQRLSRLIQRLEPKAAPT